MIKSIPLVSCGYPSQYCFHPAVPSLGVVNDNSFTFGSSAMSKEQLLIICSDESARVLFVHSKIKGASTASNLAYGGKSRLGFNFLNSACPT